MRVFFRLSQRQHSTKMLTTIAFWEQIASLHLMTPQAEWVQKTVRGVFWSEAIERFIDKQQCDYTVSDTLKESKETLFCVQCSWSLLGLEPQHAEWAVFNGVIACYCLTAVVSRVWLFYKPDLKLIFFFFFTKFWLWASQIFGWKR